MSELTLRSPVPTQTTAQISLLRNALVQRENGVRHNSNFPDFMGRTIDDVRQLDSGLVVPSGTAFSVFVPRYPDSGRSPALRMANNESRMRFGENNNIATGYMSFVGGLGAMCVEGTFDRTRVDLEDAIENGHAASRLFRGLLTGSVSIDTISVS